MKVTPRFWKLAYNELGFDILLFAIQVGMAQSSVFLLVKIFDTGLYVIYY